MPSVHRMIPGVDNVIDREDEVYEIDVTELVCQILPTVERYGVARYIFFLK